MWTLLCRCGSAAQHQLRMVDKNLARQAAHMKAMCRIGVPKARAHLCCMPDTSCQIHKERINLHLIHVRGNVAFLGCKLSVKGTDDASTGVLKHLHAAACRHEVSRILRAKCHTLKCGVYVVAATAVLDFLTPCMGAVPIHTCT